MQYFSRNTKTAVTFNSSNIKHTKLYNEKKCTSIYSQINMKVHGTLVIQDLQRSYHNAIGLVYLGLYFLMSRQFKALLCF